MKEEMSNPKHKKESHNDTMSNSSWGVSGKILDYYLDRNGNKVITGFRVDSVSLMNHTCKGCNCNTLTHGCFCDEVNK